MPTSAPSVANLHAPTRQSPRRRNNETGIPLSKLLGAAVGGAIASIDANVVRSTLFVQVGRRKRLLIELQGAKVIAVLFEIAPLPLMFKTPRSTRPSRRSSTLFIRAVAAQRPWLTPVTSATRPDKSAEWLVAVG